MDKMNASAKMAVKAPFWKNRAVLAVITVIVAVAILIMVPIFLYQAKVNMMTDTADKVGTDVAEHAGGTKYYTFTKGGNIWNAICVDDGPCPRVAAAWAIPVNAQDETNLLKQIADTEGYADVAYGTDGTSVTGKKSGMTVEVQFTSLFSYTPSSPAPAGKEWRALFVSVH